jgi:hypothetical protein
MAEIRDEGAAASARKEIRLVICGKSGARQVLQPSLIVKINRRNVVKDKQVNLTDQMEEPPQNAEGAGSSNFENARGEETEGQVERRAPAGDEEDKDSPTEVLRC